MDFDELNGVSVCKKYVPKIGPYNPRIISGGKLRKRAKDRIVDKQWNFHCDTSNLRRNIHRVFPGDDISISWKEHGTSAVFANLLIQNDLKWYEKLLVKLGVRIQTEKYGFIWSSRKVIKGVDGVEKPGSVHYYGEDVWGNVASRVASRIPKGYSIYGEILGFTPSGGAIQSMGGKPYDYGCGPNECKLHVYRVTITNVDGVVVDMPFKQMVDWCHQNGFETVPVIYYGKASEFLPLLPGQSVEQWQEVLLRKLEAEYVDDRVCHLCKSGVVQEGIVLRTDFAGKCEAKKLKSFRFLSGSSEEADKGVVDLETAESDLAEDQA